ncbi:hypothetical protein EIN_186780 [Entamoeba invadens IP1]|uniref:hypothetical protein n=1 Tax=Entamoeba invadens IP1 TaxID=370355 RepID=UPI0002C3EF06|nr:hypothetical protein EIN_186780 [Entamoeba invadens IP1]ELP94241.1 hypothetical protein EIN_186780 [Entamoeba invadens IP1]|eukprot:XP_004261012.1 hypothetical protein EIN_186780 [Entamoeba invadens IP1]
MSKPHESRGGLRQYKNVTNQKMLEQAIFIVLINRHAEVMIKRRNVKPSVTLPFVCISQIAFSVNDSVLFSQMVEEKITSIMKDEISKGVKESTATERMKKNRIKQTNYFLIDILSELGYKYTWIIESKKVGTAPHEIIESIVCTNGQVIQRDDIEKSGKKISEFLAQAVKEKPCVLFERNEPRLQQRLNITQI